MTGQEALVQLAPESRPHTLRVPGFVNQPHHRFEEDIGEGEDWIADRSRKGSAMRAWDGQGCHKPISSPCLSIALYANKSSQASTRRRAFHAAEAGVLGTIGEPEGFGDYWERER